jgi:hypothetical protein
VADVPPPDATDHPPDSTVGDVLDRVRTGAAAVAERSRHVRIVEARVPGYAAELVANGVLDAALASGDPWSVEGDDEESMVALVLALDTINFGSGWHPVVRKRPGCSGAVTMATNLRGWAAERERLRADDLVRFDAELAHEVFDQPHDGGPVDELMTLFAAALADLGRLVEGRFDGSFVALVASADGSAAALVELLRCMPSFEDVATYGDLEVPILKRAQIAVADLHRAFAGAGPGRFDDVDRLTAFADNLVPHVLRLDGVLEHSATLLARIDAGELLAPGSPEEVEIRAVGLHAVELVRRALADQGHLVPSWHLDQVLWTRGGGAAYKAAPRHRARSPFY